MSRPLREGEGGGVRADRVSESIQEEGEEVIRRIFTQRGYGQRPGEQQFEEVGWNEKGEISS
ncbi:hypothetical protein IE53DRAFT_382564 [Violaceomyces palustris]|uniref:Uncharacterized protein n=1 Tax=Violaceomyces palustris TaxID=1673888 RepID=A0ACD0NLZ4_9BASI|nr:hypothetical protein IE53DRAFT_382564 [Violaceomyces palustris]